jgi:hypothetical protein
MESKEFLIYDNKVKVHPIEEKIFDPKFTDSMKSNITYQGKELGINHIENDDEKREKLLSNTDNLINEQDQDEIHRNKGKVYYLNYFDTQTGSYKKILVKKIKNSNSVIQG